MPAVPWKHDLALAALVALACPATGQAPSSCDPPRRLITLNVAATDAKGNPVRNLQPADVRVREDGRIQPIVFFRFMGGRPTISPTPQPLTVILLDRWNDRLIPSDSARHDIDKAILRLKSVDRVYVYFLTHRGDLLPVHPLPLTDGESRASSGITPADLVAKLDQAWKNVYGMRHHLTQNPSAAADTTIEALDTLVRQMSSFTGRKSLIWITHGVPLVMFGLVDLTPTFDSLSAIAMQSGTAIYTVAQSSRMQRPMLTLERLAEFTGGRSYMTGNAGTAITGATRDTSGAYRLAYYAPTSGNDRAEHRIRVETTRTGVRLLAPQRNVAGGAAPDTDELEKSFLGSGARVPFDATDIRLRVTTSRDHPPGTIRFDIAVDPADVLLERCGGRYRASLDVAVEPYRGSAGQPPSPEHWDVDLTPEQFANATTTGLHRSQTLALSGDVRKVRVLVFDRRLAALGSATVSLDPGP